MEFAEKHGGSNLEINDVLFDHKNLVFDMNLLPNLPWPLRTELILSVEREDTLKEKTDKIIAKLVEEKTSCLGIFEVTETARIFSLDNYNNQEVTNVKKSQKCETAIDESVKAEFDEATFQLRKARKIIYIRIGLMENVEKEIQGYRFQVETFVKKFKPQLNSNEVKIWKNKIKRTEVDAIKSTTCVEELKEVRDLNGLNFENTDVKTSKDCVKKSKEAFALNDINVEEVGIHEAPERDVLVPAVREVFDAATVQEAFVQSLPRVPVDDPFDDENRADEEIEKRLKKLKTFNKVWNSSCVSNEKTKQYQTEPKFEETFNIDTYREPQRNSSILVPPIESQESVNSTSEDVENFNNWYLSKIYKKEKSRSGFKARKFPDPHSQDDDNLFVEVDSMNVKHDEELHSCCDCYKELLYEKENKVPSMVNLQAILMVLIAISQLLYGQVRTFSKFNFSHVPSSSPLTFFSSPISPSNSILSSATSAPVSSCPTLEFPALLSRTQEEVSALASLWLRWLEARVCIRARYAKDTVKLVIRNLISRNFWKQIANQILSDSIKKV